MCERERESKRERKRERERLTAHAQVCMYTCLSDNTSHQITNSKSPLSLAPNYLDNYVVCQTCTTGMTTVTAMQSLMH